MLVAPPHAQAQMAALEQEQGVDGWRRQPSNGRNSCLVRNSRFVSAPEDKASLQLRDLGVHSVVQNWFCGHLCLDKVLTVYCRIHWAGLRFACIGLDHPLDPLANTTWLKTSSYSSTVASASIPDFTWLPPPFQVTVLLFPHLKMLGCCRRTSPRSSQERYPMLWLGLSPSTPPSVCNLFRNSF